jgi:hypothetical protein
LQNIADVCTFLKASGVQPFDPKAKRSCQMPAKKLWADSTATELKRAFAHLGDSLDRAWISVSSLLEMRPDGMGRVIFATQATIAAFVAFWFAFVLSVIVKYGRIKQLYNEMDPFDSTAMDRLRDEAAVFLRATGDSRTVDLWMITPQAALGLLTPLEAIRYNQYRSELFDSLKRRPGDDSPNVTSLFGTERAA